MTEVEIQQAQALSNCIICNKPSNIKRWMPYSHYYRCPTCETTRRDYIFPIPLCELDNDEV